MNQRSHQIQYGDVTIQYDLIFAPRKTLAIRVHPDLRVTVRAPYTAQPDEVASIVRKRAPWILRQQRELERYHPPTPPRQFVSGETHRYLGRQYRLKVFEAERGFVKLTRGHLQVAAPNPADTAAVRQLVDGWYRRQARRIFHERLQAMLPRFRQLAIPEPDLTIKPMTSRWGSCSSTGKVTLNLALVQTPKANIDYVIVHELCHLVEHNHSQRFYLLLDRLMPDWRDRRQGLAQCEVH